MRPTPGGNWRHPRRTTRKLFAAEVGRATRIKQPLRIAWASRRGEAAIIAPPAFAAPKMSMSGRVLSNAVVDYFLSPVQLHIITLYEIEFLHSVDQRVASDVEVLRRAGLVIIILFERLSNDLFLDFLEINAVLWQVE